MAAHPNPVDLPTVYVHRLPSFNISIVPALPAHFRLFDPLLAPPDSDSSFLLQSVRALLSISPPIPITADTLSRLPSLQLLVATSAGVDHVDLAECRRRGIAVTSAGAAFSEDVADYAVGLLIDVLRRISAANRYVRGGFWPLKGDYPLGFKLGGKRIGILGLGSIGSEIAKRLLGFGCKIAYNSRSKKPSVPFPFYENVHSLAANSDILIVCCTLTEETHHIINEDVMRALGKEGVIVNVGRGTLLDEKQLVEFLVRRELGGAGLDVFEDEPNVPKELFDMDNVVLSPHTAVLTPESLAAVQDVMLANLKAFFAGEPLISPV